MAGNFVVPGRIDKAMSALRSSPVPVQLPGSTCVSANSKPSSSTRNSCSVDDDNGKESSGVRPNDNQTPALPGLLRIRSLPGVGNASAACFDNYYSTSNFSLATLLVF